MRTLATPGTWTPDAPTPVAQPADEPAPAAPRKILLHVGTPKTGTTYFQDVLFRNQELLAEAGIHYPADRFDAHFLAALNLMRLPWGGLETEALGAWDRLAEQVRTQQRHQPGTTIISHEILATATRAEAGRALASLGHRSGADDEPEIHVVVSVRDLMRQIPAEWQENVKHRSTLSYGRFLEQIRDPARDTRIGSWFWGVQEVPAILDRWAHDLPPERVHLVTVPPPGGAPDLLWKRFRHVFDLDGLDLDLTTDRANPSLGASETALIRRINRSANTRLRPPDYRPLVRELLAHRTLSQRSSSPRLGLPPEMHQWVADLEHAWVDELAARGYDVVGDLGELVGIPPEVWVDPDDPPEEEVADAAVDAITALSLEAARARHEEGRLAGELHEVQVALERAYLRPSYRWRERIVQELEGRAPGRAVLRGYRFARGRSSPSA